MPVYALVVEILYKSLNRLALISRPTRLPVPKKLVCVKLPFKIKIIDLTNDENSFQGKTIFHGKKYSIKIHSTIQEKIIKFPFSVIGVTEDKILVRISGPSGVYVEDYMRFKGESKRIEIESDIMYDEISNNHDKLFNILEGIYNDTLKKLNYDERIFCREEYFKNIYEYIT